MNQQVSFKDGIKSSGSRENGKRCNEVGATAGASSSGIGSDNADSVATAAPISEVNVDNASNQEQSADILKLDIDCLDESCDYLQLTDLLSVGETCKQLNQMVGYLFHKNYPAVAITSSKPKKRIPHKNMVINDRRESNLYNQFIRKIDICLDGGFENFREVHSQFRRLKTIHLINIKLNASVLKDFEGIFRKIECLGVKWCRFDGNFHDSILTFCPNLKRLHLVPTAFDDNPILMGNELDWVHRKYPTLEYFAIEKRCERPNLNELITFLELNPNIRKLSIAASYLKGASSGHLLMRSHVELDELAIRFEWDACDIEMCQLLKKLHECGFYERLTLCMGMGMTALSQQVIEEIATLNALVELEIPFYANPIELSTLKSLQKLCIYPVNPDDTLILPYLLNLANNLTKLERLEVSCGSFDLLLPFIRNAVRLNQIKIMHLEDGTHFSRATNVVDLQTLNRERAKLAEAKKMTIYVDEKVYLATKWTLNETDFSLIRLKRVDSYEWDYCFLD